MFRGGFWFIPGVFWYISSGFMVHFRGVLVQLGGFCGAIMGGLWYNSGGFKYTSGVFQYILSGQFLGFFFKVCGCPGRVLGASSELPPPPPQIVCPGLALLVVHVAGPFRQISGMEVGEGSVLLVLLGCRRGL